MTTSPYHEYNIIFLPSECVRVSQPYSIPHGDSEQKGARV